MKQRVQRLVNYKEAERPVVMPETVDSPEPSLLPLHEAARRMGIGIKTLQARIADGTIFAIPVGTSGKYMKVPVAEVEKWRVGGYGSTLGNHGLRHLTHE